MIYGIFGEANPSAKLVTAALNDQLETAANDDEEFALVVGVNKHSPSVYVTIAQWAVRNEINVSYYTTMTKLDVLRTLDLSEFWEHKQYKSVAAYMIEVVERLYTESRNGGSVMIYALLGSEEPSVDVRRAFARAVDNGLEIRDLAEAGLTVVGIADNPIKTTGSITVADQEITIEEAGASADDGDEEAMAVLVEFAGQYELDPDDFPTWAGLAAALDPLLSAEQSEQQEQEQEEEEEEERPRSRRTRTLSAEELEDKSVPDLRNLAKQLGVEGWDRNRSAKLIEGILAAQDGDSEGDSPPPVSAARTAPVQQNGDDLRSALAQGLRLLADALEA